jgi:hypothetical protein
MPVEPANRGEPEIALLPMPDHPDGPSWGRVKAIRGLLWCEWYAHGRLLLLFLAAWLACAWVLPLYANPACILFFGAIFAVIAGPVYGGGDTAEGCEEFTFALPPTRFERYWARLAVGVGALLLFTAMDLLALGLDLSQVLAKLYVSSGLIHPWPVFRSGLLYGLVLALPAAVFAFAFVISALTRSRAILLSAPLWAALFSLAALRLGLWYEELLWETFNGWFSCPLLVVLAAAVLWGGGWAYQRKEVGHEAAPLAVPARWWLWVALTIGALALAVALAASLAKHYEHFFKGLTS